MAGFDLTLLRHSFIHLGVWRLHFLGFVVSKTPGVSRVIARPLYDPTEGFDAKWPNYITVPLAIGVAVATPNFPGSNSAPLSLSLGWVAWFHAFSPVTLA